ncbi:hypothetical protein LTR08_001186 [Meristemomyces frigidus]|nr:hypothetical protein LTR08_001186 [Meristemomyces frigidus]
MAPTIHCVRHAQGFHNLSTANHALPDPLLTPLGEAQCRFLAQTFPSPAAIDAVVASPMKRTLYTALLSFPTALATRNIKVVALPELQETSDMPCDTGSTPAELATEFADKPVDLRLVPEGWNDKRAAKWAPNNKAVEARARDARLWLLARPEREIVLVAHGGFLHYLTEDWAGSDRLCGTGWSNTEFRSYTFAAPSNNNDPASDAHLVETPSSRQRRRGDPTAPDREEQAQLKRAAVREWGAQGYVGVPSAAPGERDVKVKG